MEEFINIKQFTEKNTISLLLEGVQVAFENIEIALTELKKKTWEELKIVI